MKRPPRALNQALSALLAPLLAFAPVFAAAPAQAQVVEVAARVGAVGAVAPAAAAIGQSLSVPALASPLAAPAAPSPAAAPVGAAAAPALSAPVAAAADPSAPTSAGAPAAAVFSAAAKDDDSAPKASAASAAKAAAPAGSAPTSRKRASAKSAPDSARAQLEGLAARNTAAVSGDFDGARKSRKASAAKYGLLGAKKSAKDSRNLQLQKYITADLPDAPATADFSGPVKNWGMMLNDTIGDCTVAACGHQIQQWTANAGTQKTTPDSIIQKVYSAVSGYKPGQPSTDGGADPLTVLKYWRKNGIGGDKIGAFAQVDYTNFDHIRQAVWLFGGAYLAIALPKSAQKQTVWDVPTGGAVGNGAPGSWGGHAVAIAGYTPKGLVVVTWGALKLLTWDFLKTYGEESFAIISQDFLKNGKTPNNGLDIPTLKADLKAVTSTPARIPKKRKPAPPARP
jgi:hypothetical protein